MRHDLDSQHFDEFDEENNINDEDDISIKMRSLFQILYYEVC